MYCRTTSPYTRARGMALFPLLYPTTCDTAYFGGIAIGMGTWSGLKCPSRIRLSLCSASLRNTSPRCFRNGFVAQMLPSPRFRGMSKKHRYKIRNWNAYNRALINRGSLTLWIDEEAAHTQWCNTEKNGRRGRDLTSSDGAIQCGLTLKVLYRLPLRATQGLVASLLEWMGLDLPTPSYTQICRRQAPLTGAVPRRKAERARHIVIDSTGLKVYGEGEWKVRQHGGCQRGGPGANGT